MKTTQVRTTRVGLKLWSGNLKVAQRAGELFRQGWIDLVELYVVPETHDDTIRTWRDLEVPFMLHCPHSAHGFNLAKSERSESNSRMFREVQSFADALSVNVIVTHGGNRGDIDETIRQLKRLNDRRIHIENKPKVSLTGGVCIGHSPEEIVQLINSADLSGFVLDFGHATCAANSVGEGAFGYIERFLQSKPSTFHIGDGDRTSEKDKHLNFGDGDFDIARLVSFVPPHSVLTIETPTDPDGDLVDFVENLRYLRNIVRQQLLPQERSHDV